jgi:hypothetical protein
VFRSGAFILKSANTARSINVANPVNEFEVEGDISASSNVFANTVITRGGGSLGSGNFSTLIGNARVGYNGLSNSAVFPHSGNNDIFHYAISQSSAGATAINSSTEQITTFNIEGVEKMRLDADGNVGIGLTNPTTKLEVIGDISCNSIQAPPDTEISQIGDMKFGNVSRLAQTNERTVVRHMAHC